MNFDKLINFRIIYLQVIHEFSRDQNTCDYKPMHIEGIDRQKWLLLHEPIQIYIRDDVTRIATIRVIEDPLEIASDGNGRFG